MTARRRPVALLVAAGIVAVMTAAGFQPGAAWEVAIFAVLTVIATLLSRRLAGEGLIQRLLDILPNYFLIGLGLVSCTLGLSRLLH